MKLLTGAEVRDLLDWPSTIEALENIFRTACITPVRHHHNVPVSEGSDATMLLMPAWTSEFLGVKIANVFPGNGRCGLPAVMATYLLSCARTGTPLALVDGGELTARRTAGASALAAKYLARKDAKRLLLVGTGRIAANLAHAHSAILPIDDIRVWGRNSANAEKLAATLRDEGLKAVAVGDLAEEVANADIVSCATLSTTPLVLGEWLTEGTHLDLVGGFTPGMREADDEAIRCASVFVDTREGATAEAGDIITPLKSGVLKREDIRAELGDFAFGRHAGRTNASEITLFKSVGASLEDLATAILAYKRAVTREKDAA